MDSFPADFNLESILKEPQQFDNTNPSLKEQRKRIYTYMISVVPRGNRVLDFDMPPEMTSEDRKQLARELCACFPDHVDYSVSDVEAAEWIFAPVEDTLNPPASQIYRIRIK